jgi:hypothetical protein
MHIKIDGHGEKKELLHMLAWIEYLGNVGHSTFFRVFVDGDGATRWKFKFDDTEQQKDFDEIRKAYRGTDDIERFAI